MKRILGGGTFGYPNITHVNETNNNYVTEENILYQYLYIEPVEDNAKIQFISFDMYGTIDEAFLPPRNILQYSLDRKQWFDLPDEGIIVNKQRVYFKCENPITDVDLDTYEQGIGTFVVHKNYKVGGNIMSLLFGDNFIGKTDLTGFDYTFSQLFQGSFISTLPDNDYDNTKDMHGWCIDAYNLSLPATTLTINCYCCMFGNQQFLNRPPFILPAEELVTECYSYMFSSTGIIQAPIVNAVKFADYSCQYMFGNTPNIFLPVTLKISGNTYAEQCMYHMFNNSASYPYLPNVDFSDPETINSGICTGLFASSGITDEGLATMLPINPETGRYCLPVTELTTSYCYEAMFAYCHSLTTAPELPATTLSLGCYSQMFYCCHALQTPPPILPATTLINECYNDMFGFCESLTYTPVLVDSEYTNRGTSEDMFFECKSLSKITCLWKTNNENDCVCTYHSDITCNRSYCWLRGVPNVSTSTFIMSADATWKNKKEYTECGSGICGSWIPSKWTVEYV